jgi:hypothetical protein
MDYTKLKIFFYVAVCLTMLLAPFTLDITPDGKAFAFGSHSGRNGESQTRKAPEREMAANMDLVQFNQCLNQQQCCWWAADWPVWLFLEGSLKNRRWGY